MLTEDVILLICGSRSEYVTSGGGLTVWLMLVKDEGFWLNEVSIILFFNAVV